MTRPAGYEQSIGADTVAIVMRGAGDPDLDDVVGRALAEQLDMTVVNLHPGTTMDALDADDMRAAGWIRREPVRDAVDALAVAWREFYTLAVAERLGGSGDASLRIAQATRDLLAVVGNVPDDGARWERPPDTGRG